MEAAEGLDCNLLVGNGWSIACDAVYDYSNLLDRAREIGLSALAEDLFDKLGTADFEIVLRHLERPEAIEALTGWSPEADILRDFRDGLRDALVASMMASHLNRRRLISDDALERCQAFLARFDNVFTTNYDLLLYWVEMYDDNPHQFCDGFGRHFPSGRLKYYGNFRAFRPRIWYLHGALHLYSEGQSVFKREAGSRPLIDVIRPAFEDGEYPLLVTEGSQEHKMRRIQGNRYLRDAYEELRRVSGVLVVFGHSLSSSDDHICRAIASAPDLGGLLVSSLHPPGSDGYEKVAKRCRHIQMLRVVSYDLPPVDIRIYDARSASVWTDWKMYREAAREISHT